MIYKLEPKERELYIQFYETIFQSAQQDSTFGAFPIYITGGSCRRLHALQNGLDLHINDMKAMLSSDIDIHATPISMGYARSSTLFPNLYPTQKDIMYDGFGLMDIPITYGYNMKERFSYINPFYKSTHILNRLLPIIEELSPYRKKLFGDTNHNTLDEVLLIKFQYIRIENMDRRLLPQITEHDIINFDIRFDLDSSRFVFWNGKLYDKRMFPNNEYEDHLITTINPFKTIERIKKFESYGYIYSKQNIVDVITTCYEKYYTPPANKSDYTKAEEAILDSEYGIRVLDIIPNPEIVDESTMLDSVNMACQSPFIPF